MLKLNAEGTLPVCGARNTDTKQTLARHASPMMAPIVAISTLLLGTDTSTPVRQKPAWSASSPSRGSSTTGPTRLPSTPTQSRRSARTHQTPAVIGTLLSGSASAQVVAHAEELMEEVVEAAATAE